MPGLIRGVARTAVIAGTATVRVEPRLRGGRRADWAAKDQQQYEHEAYEQQQQQQAPPPQQYAAPPPQYAAPPPPPPRRPPASLHGRQARSAAAARSAEGRRHAHRGRVRAAEGASILAS